MINIRRCIIFRMKLVSVIVPVYNAEKYLARCIDSILNQIYQNIEIILINDGSSDNSLLICKEYEKKDSRVVTFNKVNGGVSSARNLGLDNARGEYIVFVDSDDYIEPMMISNMVGSALQGHNWILSGYIYRNALDEKIKEFSLSTSDLAVNCEEMICFLEKNWAPWGKLYHRDIIGDIRFDETITIAEDLKFNMEILCNVHIKDIKVLWKVYYNYLENYDGAMRQKYTPKILLALKTEEECLHMYGEKGFDNNLLKKILVNGLFLFYYKISFVDFIQWKEYLHDYRIAREIVQRNKEYLLKNKNLSFKEKTMIRSIVYFPELYILLMKIYHKIQYYRTEG